MTRSARGFAGRYGPWAVIAGASEGIGAAFARSLAKEGRTADREPSSLHGGLHASPGHRTEPGRVGELPSAFLRRRDDRPRERVLAVGLDRAGLARDDDSQHGVTIADRRR